jgi:hypothetical protein
MATDQGPPSHRKWIAAGALALVGVGLAVVFIPNAVTAKAGDTMTAKAGDTATAKPDDTAAAAAAAKAAALVAKAATDAKAVADAKAKAEAAEREAEDARAKAAEAAELQKKADAALAEAAEKAAADEADAELARKAEAARVLAEEARVAREELEKAAKAKEEQARVAKEELAAAEAAAKRRLMYKTLGIVAAVVVAVLIALVVIARRFKVSERGQRPDPHAVRRDAARARIKVKERLERAGVLKRAMNDAEAVLKEASEAPFAVMSGARKAERLEYRELETKIDAHLKRGDAIGKGSSRRAIIDRWRWEATRDKLSAELLEVRGKVHASLTATKRAFDGDKQKAVEAHERAVTEYEDFVL